MLKNERRMEQQMNGLTKQSSKFLNNVAGLKETIEKQQRETEKIRELVAQRREDLATRTKLNEAVQEQAAAAKECTEAMQDHLVRTEQEQSQIRGCVHTLCEATNTFVNARELPVRMKGVSVSHSGDEWLPFDVSASDLKGLSTIWNRLNIPSENVNKWRQLLSASNPQSDKENITIAASIIEIDLTSPVSQK
ncbi:hypothetical protein ACLKA7_009576 [Drosophila subpalustris]